jgi:hypothetical protein
MITEEAMELTTKKLTFGTEQIITTIRDLTLGTNIKVMDFSP